MANVEGHKLEMGDGEGSIEEERCMLDLEG